MTDTPRTNDIARGNHVVPTEFAEDLERETQNLQLALNRWRELAEQLARLAMDGTHLLDDQLAALAQLHRLKTSSSRP